MSENATACRVAERAGFAPVRLEAAGPDEARTAGEARLEDRLPGHITRAGSRPEPRP
jgi:hypothetical protein